MTRSGWDLKVVLLTNIVYCASSNVLLAAPNYEMVNFSMENGRFTLYRPRNVTSKQRHLVAFREPPGVRNIMHEVQTICLHKRNLHNLLICNCISAGASAFGRRFITLMDKGTCFMSLFHLVQCKKQISSMCTAQKCRLRNFFVVGSRTPADWHRRCTFRAFKTSIH